MSPGPGGPPMPMTPMQMPGQQPFGAPRLEVLEAKVDCITRAIFDLQAEIQGLLRVRKQINAVQAPPWPGPPPPGVEHGHMAPLSPHPYNPVSPPPYAAHGAHTPPHPPPHPHWGDPRMTT